MNKPDLSTLAKQYNLKAIESLNQNLLAKQLIGMYVIVMVVMGSLDYVYDLNLIISKHYLAASFIVGLIFIVVQEFLDFKAIGLSCAVAKRLEPLISNPELVGETADPIFVGPNKQLKRCLNSLNLTSLDFDKYRDGPEITGSFDDKSPIQILAIQPNTGLCTIKVNLGNGYGECVAQISLYWISQCYTSLEGVAEAQKRMGEAQAERTAEDHEQRLASMGINTTKT